MGSCNCCVIDKNTVMEDYGIKKVLPNLSNEKVEEVLKFLEGLGVESYDDLKKYVTVEKLMRNNLLKEIQAQKLVEYWKTGEFSQTSQDGTAPKGGVSQTIHGNTDRAIAVQGTYNENQHGTKVNNLGTIQGDVVAGGNKTHIKTDFGGANLKVGDGGALHTGQGNIGERQAGNVKPKNEERNEGSVDITTTFGNNANVTIEGGNVHTGQGDVNPPKAKDSLKK